MHVSCLRCSRKGMRLDDRKISKRKRRCNHEKNKRMQALLRLKQEQLGQLHVRAGMRGVLQAVPVEVGSQVTAGTNVARVADPALLKAQVRVPETCPIIRFNFDISVYESRDEG